MSIKAKMKNLSNMDRKKIIRIVIIAIVVIAVIGGICAALFMKGAGNKNKKSDNELKTTFVTRGNVETTITGSGSLEPYERYEVIPLVNGEIIYAPFGVGDFVEEGAVVYEFDKTDAQINLQKQRNSMQKSTITYNESMEQKDDLIIKAPCSGVVQDISVKTGDEISQGKQITQIINNQDLKVKLPFNAAQIENIHEGDAAVLTSSVAMSSINGTVSNISSTPEAAADGASLYYVTINFQNPGAVLEGDVFGGSVNGIVSPGSGNAMISESDIVSAKISGTVSDIYCKEGDYVKEGDILVQLTSETVENSLKRSRIEYEDAKLSLENQENTLDDYRVTAPISGTVLVKNSKAGDTIDRTNSSVTMMVIGDVSKLKFTLSIDELDVAKIQIGQKVNITADAVENKTFVGEITNIAMEGTATNGVTTYEAQVTIANPQELKPSMNVDAVVVVESAENVLRVQSSDITTSMGRNYVFVKDDGTVLSAEENGPMQLENQGMPQEMPQGMMSGSENGQMPEGAMTQRGERPQMPQGSEKGQNAESEAMPGNEIPTAGERPEGGMKERPVRIPEAPEGFVAVEVKIGIQGDEFTEIKEGLLEGQEIYQKQVTSSGGSMGFGMAGGFGGFGGGMPGGMGGGMSGGGMRR